MTLSIATNTIATNAIAANSKRLQTSSLYNANDNASSVANITNEIDNNNNIRDGDYSIGTYTDDDEQSKISKLSYAEVPPVMNYT